MYMKNLIRAKSSTNGLGLTFNGNLSTYSQRMLLPLCIANIAALLYQRVCVCVCACLSGQRRWQPRATAEKRCAAERQCEISLVHFHVAHYSYLFSWQFFVFLTIVVFVFVSWSFAEIAHWLNISIHIRVHMCNVYFYAEGRTCFQITLSNLSWILFGILSKFSLPAISRNFQSIIWKNKKKIWFPIHLFDGHNVSRL